MDDRMVRPHRRRWLLWSAVGLVLVAVVVGGLLISQNARGNGKKKKSDKSDPPAAAVEVTAVRRGDIATYLQTTTTLEARNTAGLVASRQGQVKEILAEEGQWVQAGAVLARLDDTEARLAVERDEVGAKMAEREAERGNQLHEQGFLSAKELDDLELKRRSAAVTLDEARYNLTQTRLTAPFTGRVTSRTINLGETVTAGRECFRLEDFDPILAKIYLPERELPRVQTGQPAVIELDTHPGKQFPARVSLVNPVVDRTNGTFKVTLEVRDRERILRPGNFARVRLRTGSFASALILPRRAMVSEDGEDYVFVARSDTVARVRVSVGAITGDSAQVLAGLSAGDSVVTVGQGGLKQGSRIKSVRF